MPWGIHPELIRDPAESDGDVVRLFFPGGFMSKRKPLEPTLKAFRKAKGPELRLVVKAQVERGVDTVRDAARKDERIEVIAEDLPTDEHLRLFASADVCLAPSRWEGLGLHLFEATALGLPIVTNDNPPMNEVVEDGRNGLLVAGKPSKQRPRSDIGSFDPDRRALTKAIESLRDPDLRDAASRGRSREARGALLEPHRRGARRSVGDWGLSDRTLVREQFFPSPVDEVFKPFSRAENLEAITPAVAALPDRLSAADRDAGGRAHRIQAPLSRCPGPLADRDRRLGPAPPLRRPRAPEPLRALAPHARPSKRSRAARSLATPCATAWASARSASWHTPSSSAAT